MEYDSALIKKGALALLKRDLYSAYHAFAAAYQSENWEARDVAVTGLNDLLDSRTYEKQKMPSILLILGWYDHPPLPPSTLISDERILILLENFLRRSVSSSQTIAEQKCLQAMRRSTRMLKEIILNDPHHLVRFSAFLALRNIPGDSQRHFLVPILQQALRRETNPSLAAAIAAELTDFDHA